jgi:hypothetical protein
MLGSWYVHGYEGSTRAERRKFYSQRDDPCESDHETDQQLTCFRRKKRLRKVRRQHSHVRQDNEDDAQSDGEDTYDLVETSCSSSNHSDGDIWGFGDEQPPRDSVMAHDHNDSAAGGYGAVVADQGSPPMDCRIAHCIPKLAGVPALMGASSALLFDGSFPTAVMLHGGLPLSRKSAASTPSNMTYFLTRSEDQKGWIASSACDPRRVVVVNVRKDIKRAKPDVDVLSISPPQSLKRWATAAQLPHRFGHCTATLPRASVPVHDATMLAEWNALPWEGGLFDAVDVSMTVTLGGSGDGHVPLVGHSRTMRNRQLEGCILAEPALQLFVRLRRQLDGSCALWSSAVRLLPEVPEGHMVPRVFFSLCQWTHPSSASAHPRATFLICGGTEDGESPLDDNINGGVSLLSIDATERTFSLEPFATLGAPPAPRFGHTMTLVESDHHDAPQVYGSSATYVLHGGIGFLGTVFSDVYLLDGSSRVWREIIVPVGDAVIARPRAFHVAWCCSGTRDSGSNSPRIVFSGGESSDRWSQCLDAITAFYPCQHRWSPVACPSLDLDPLDDVPENRSLIGQSRRGPTSSVLPTSDRYGSRLSTPASASDFLAQELGGSEAARNDVVLRDILHLAQERQASSSFTTTISSGPQPTQLGYPSTCLGAGIGGVCHGSIASVVATPHDGSAWIFGGTQNLHRTHLSAVQLRESDGSLKEAVALWLLRHEGNSTAADHHARRLSADAQLKHWWSMM